jgi:hypothetical protein
VIRSPGKPASSSANAQDYRAAFLAHVHELLLLGYARMDARSFADEQEPVITGELVKAMNEVVDDEGSADWVRYLHPSEEPPVNSGSRRGKGRKRIDIRVDSSERRPRQRFSFEAKRLGNGHSVKKYLGPEGLGCFLDGHYAASDGEAGMLGYVQSGIPEEWADQIRRSVEVQGNPYLLAHGGRWQPVRFPGVTASMYVSVHVRRNLNTQIEIYHTFLVFQ